ncbi:YuiA family protein [Aneurinibacillus sp. BA2021]|nr:YuiA family protein [Aneurinibacillus sp. BA2021]
MNEKMNHDTCVYCGGNGYFQLVTGGSTTCPSCSGQGKADAHEPEMTARAKWNKK